MHRRVYDLDKGCFTDGEQLKSNDMKKTVKWRVHQTLQVGCLVPLKTIENKVRSFCWKHDLKCEVLKSGWFVKDVEFLISGESTMQDAKDCAEALRKWFLDLEKL